MSETPQLQDMNFSDKQVKAMILAMGACEAYRGKVAQLNKAKYTSEAAYDNYRDWFQSEIRTIANSVVA